MSSSRPGAVGDPPAHYGNPIPEQRALAAGEAIVELGDREVIAVTGPDRLTWLDSLTSQSLARLQPGVSTETLLLDPTGRIEHAIRLVDDSVTAWLLVDAGRGAALAAWLDRMRFLLRVEVSLVEDYLTVGAFAGPAAEALDALAAAPNAVALRWNDPWSAVAVGGHQYARSTDHDYAAWTYREVLVPRATDLTSIPASGTLALEALRIAAWRPALSTEADERSIPHELDWLRSAVHLAKGCYRGQETVAKVHNLGHPPRRLVMLHLDGSEGILPAADSPVSSAEGEVGRVTSSAVHHELGPIALAVIKRAVDPNVPLIVTAEGRQIAAAQEVIVPTDAGAEVDVPRLPRLGAVRRG